MNVASNVLYQSCVLVVMWNLLWSPSLHIVQHRKDSMGGIVPDYSQKLRTLHCILFNASCIHFNAKMATIVGHCLTAISYSKYWLHSRSGCLFLWNYLHIFLLKIGSLIWYNLLRTSVEKLHNKFMYCIPYRNAQTLFWSLKDALPILKL
jgi:hypothetical protein